MAEETPVIIVPVEPDPIPTPPVIPVIGPLLALLRSRKVVVSVVVFLVALLVQTVPSLAPIAGTLTAVLSIFGVAVISGISLEDAAKYIGERGYPVVVPTDPQQSPEEALRKLINDILDEREAVQ